MTGQKTSTRRRRLPLAEFTAGVQILPDESAHYIRTVLRLQTGSDVEVFDGQGRLAHATVRAIEGKTVELEIGEVQEVSPPSLALTLAVAAPKGDRADLVIEKATELGASHFVWLTTKRSVVVPRKAGKKLERWRRVAQAAARQSGRAHTPTVEEPIGFAELLDRSFDHCFVCDWSGPSLLKVVTQQALIGSAVVVIGPEGGLTDDELEILKRAGYNPVNLGPNVLRVETASVAAAAILMGDCS
ncbi:MAG: RsmE family RNA methyltransferase [Myxococcota bacterium]|nr:RsmE family RNA methyltransferase [Myxococcota bacterium]